MPTRKTMNKRVQSAYIVPKCHIYTDNATTTDFDAQKRFDFLLQKVMTKSDIRGYAAIDCEMVETLCCENALARVSIVDEKCNVLYDTIVIPPGGQVVTYRTRYSGITASLVKA